ncbi:MAG TPA: riboflavin biosynthesis protein RibF [Pseudomonadota bacterium]|nr:riboflavin biosynthesis protein RibF [Pseudomonadota bacterium]
MPVFASYEEFAASSSSLTPCALVIGNFDGVHRGHKALIAEARQRIGASGRVVVLTFFPHPASVLSPQNAKQVLLSSQRKRELLHLAGADDVIEQRFDAEFAKLSATEFVERIILSGPPPHAVCVGHDFRFGQGRAGDAALLGQLLVRYGTVVTQLGAITVSTASGDTLICSSTLIRKALGDGDVDRAALLLGRAPEVEGTVVHGHGRGRTIDVPTANLRVHSDVKLRPGVYAAWAEILAPIDPSSPSVLRPVAARHPAAVNLGYNPTFQGPGTVETSPLSVEAHLLLAAGETLPSLYGCELRLCFVARLRDEKKFSQVAELVAQIHKDIATTRQLTGGTPSADRDVLAARDGAGVAMGSGTDREAGGRPPHDGGHSSSAAVFTHQDGSGQGDSSPEPKQRRRAAHDDALPETYGRDEVEILSKDPHWYFIYWEVTAAGLAQAQSQLGLSEGDGRLILRVFITTQLPQGRENREIRDLSLHQHHGKKYLESPKAGAHLRAAVGLVSKDGLFSPIAQSQSVRLPPMHPSSETAIEWAHVQPVSGDGKQREHIVLSRPQTPHKERELPWRTGSSPPSGQLPVTDSEWIVDAPSSSPTSSGLTPQPGKSGGL